MLGRPLELCALPPFSLPVNDVGAPLGNIAASVAVLTLASSPVNDLRVHRAAVAVVRRHAREVAARGDVGALFGCAPGATSTRQVYLPRALTEPFSANDSWPGSICWNHSGEVMSASGGIQPCAAASTAL